MRKDRWALLSYAVLLTLLGLDALFLGDRYAHHRSPVAGLLSLILIAAVLAVHPRLTVASA